MKKEIVDNETGGYTMAQFLNDALKANGGPISIATGFFNVEGYAKVRDNLQAAAKTGGFNLRLLFGKEATNRRETALSIGPADVEETSLIDELDLGPVGPVAQWDAQDDARRDAEGTQHRGLAHRGRSTGAVALACEHLLAK